MPEPAHRTNQPYLLYTLLTLLLLVALRYHVQVMQSRFEETAHGQDIVDVPLDIDLPQLSVTDPKNGSEQAGIRRGDRVIAIHGHAVRGSDDFFPALLEHRPKDTVTIRVQPPAGSGRPVFDATLSFPAFKDTPPRLRDWVAFSIVDVALPFLCLALGFWVVAVRIRDPLAWLLLLLLLSLAEFGGASWRVLFASLDWFHPIAVVYQPVLANLWPLSMMLFGIYFPDRLPFDRRHPWAKWLVVVPLLFRVLGTNVASVVLTLRHADLATRVDDTFRWMQPIVTGLHFVAISVFFAALGFKRFMEKDPDARRRLRLLHIGASIAMTPLLIALILGLSGVIDLSREVVSLLLSVLFVFPLTMAYVIVVERAMDVRLVVRQGVQYLLARGSIRIFQIAISMAVLFVAIRALARNPALSSSSIAFYIPIAVGVGAVVVIGRFSDRLRGWLDRRFFREAYDAEQILSELAAQVRTIVETGPLLETVSRQISNALHVPRLAILLNQRGMLEPAYALGYVGLRPVPVPMDGSKVGTDADLRTALDAELVLPLSANKKLVGVMGLGPKQSEEPFTSSDVRLLDAVATQTGLALENSRLTAEIAAEVADREKRKREMEIAREVQQRLFPQSYPETAGLEVAGACRPALEVGGDYYDFVPLTSGRLGIAIGDISGKGIPASLLMATLRAYLRSQTIQAQDNLGVMISNLNMLVYESSGTNRYATFFYAQYDPRTRVLQYVNAGHNPPMVFRSGAGGMEVLRLDVGGPVVGLLPKCEYEEGTITLQPGDLLVSFTDGVSEAMNGEMEEWGEERLIETVTPVRTRPLQELIGRIMAGADAHAGTAPQHDDMTLVLARCV